MSILGPVTAAQPVVGGDHALNQHSPAVAKIALFRSLFRGRDDVDTVLDAIQRTLSRRRT